MNVPTDLPPEPTKPRGPRGLFHYAMPQFLAALLLFYATSPFVAHFEIGELIEAILITIVLSSAIVAIGGQRRTLVIALTLATPAVLARWLNYFRPDMMPAYVARILAMVFIAFLIVQMLQFIVRRRVVDHEVLCAAIANYLLLGFLWGFAYLLTGEFLPGSFSHTLGPDHDRPLASFDAFFFSFTTLTTAAYGNILPVTKTAKMLSSAEAITGVLYSAVLIARLVGLYASGQSARRTAEPGEMRHPKDGE